MKFKHLIVILLLLPPMAGTAQQISIGAHVGWRFTEWNAQELFNINSQLFSMESGVPSQTPDLGLRLQLKANKFILEGGLHYSFSTLSLNTNSTQTETAQQWRQHYLYVPVIAGVELLKFFRLFGGVQGTVATMETWNDEANFWDGWNQQEEATDLRVLAGTAIRAGRVRVEARVDVPLQPVRFTSIKDNTSYFFSAKQQSLIVSVGYNLFK
jgi:hypothetical protein